VLGFIVFLSFNVNCRAKISITLINY